MKDVSKDFLGTFFRRVNNILLNPVDRKLFRLLSNCDINDVTSSGSDFMDTKICDRNFYIYVFLDE